MPFSTKALFPLLRRLCRPCAFLSFILLVLVMAAATLIGHSCGTDCVLSGVYHAWWFAALWALTAVAGMAWLAQARPLLPWTAGRRHAPLWLLHLSLTLILCGAAASALTSRSGSMHLRTGVTEMAYRDDARSDRPLVRLPFSVRLTACSVRCHPGTPTPRDYVCRLSIDSHEDEVRLNHVLSAKGVRLFLLSADADLNGCTLGVRIDPIGRPVSYTGYTLLSLAFLLLFVSPRGGFRHRLRLLRGAALFLSFLLPAGASAATHAEASLPALPAAGADAFGRLHVAHGGRICPVRTLALDFCRRLTDGSGWRNYSAEQVLTGCLLWPEAWDAAPLIPVGSRALRQQLGTGRQASPADFFAADGTYRLAPLLSSPDAALARGAADADARLQALYALRNGELLRLFPVTDSVTLWRTPTEPLPAGILSPADSMLVRTAFDRLQRAASASDTATVRRLTAAIASYQQRHAAGTLPPHLRSLAERLYPALPLPAWLSRLFLSAGLLLCLLSLPRRPLPRVVRQALTLTGTGGFVALSLFIGLRTAISGRLPLGNGHETMLAAAWFALLPGWWLRRRAARLTVLRSVPFLASGFFLLTASLTPAGTEVSQLAPVLASPLLSLHVSLVMAAYALLSLTFVIALVALMRRRNRAEAMLFRLHAEVLLFPALALLAAGIFAGAVWADRSWGRYWGWDPKEVWALITLMTYALPLHARSFPLLRRPHPFFIYLCCAFGCVLMTYFGVNYLLGGLHAYAG